MFFFQRCSHFSPLSRFLMSKKTIYLVRGSKNYVEHLYIAQIDMQTPLPSLLFGNGILHPIMELHRCFLKNVNSTFHFHMKNTKWDKKWFLMQQITEVLNKSHFLNSNLQMRQNPTTIAKPSGHSLFWKFQNQIPTPRELWLRNGVGKTCVWKKYILLYE